MMNLKFLLDCHFKRGTTSIIKNRQLIRSSSTRSNRSTDQNDDKEFSRTITHPKLSYASTVSEFPIFSEVIGDLTHRNLELKKNQLVYAFPHQQVHLSFGEVHERVETAAKNLLDLGFKKGDRIALILPNVFELVILFLAASKIGLISTILNPAYQVVELEYMLKKTSAKGIVFYYSFKMLKHMEVIRRLCPEIDNSTPGELNSKALPDLKHLFVLNSPFEAEKKQYKGAWSIDRLIEKKIKQLFS